MTTHRWETAQDAEATYWKQVDLVELIRICGEKVAALKQIRDPDLELLFDGKDVLEIGCGPLGLSITAFYHARERIRSLRKIDPLHKIPLAPLRDLPDSRHAGPFIDWIQELTSFGTHAAVKAESLQSHSEYDTVITYNVLDHVDDPYMVIRKAFDALRPGGIFLVWVDCYSIIGRLRFEWLTRALSPQSILVKAHPHSFTPSMLQLLLKRAGFCDVITYGLPGLRQAIAGSHFRPAFRACKPKND